MQIRCNKIDAYNLFNVCVCVCVCHIGVYTYVGLCPIVQLIADTLLRRRAHKHRLTFFKY